MTALTTSIQSILTIVLIIALGYILQKKGWFDDKFGGTVSTLLMKVALPASIFISVLERLTLDKLISLSSGLVYGFGGVILGYIIAFILVKVLKVRPGRRGTFINMFVNANTIFIGLPLNLALFGDKSLAYFLVYYVVNTVSTWTLVPSSSQMMTQRSKRAKRVQPSTGRSSCHHHCSDSWLPWSSCCCGFHS